MGHGKLLFWKALTFKEDYLMEMLQIYTRNIELTERLRDYVEAKVAKFERFLPSLETIRVDLSESNARDS